MAWTRQWMRWSAAMVEAGASLVFPEVCQICLNSRAGRQEGYVCAHCREKPGGVKRIAPPFCQHCGLPFSGDITTEFECSNCREMELAFSFARAAVMATPLLLDVVHQYKYNRALWFEPFLAELLIDHAAEPLAQGEWDCVVPTPLHPRKLREREFNQAERLGAALAKRIGRPLRTGLARRVADTETQTRLTREARAVNVRSAFQAHARAERLRIILVDDVLTTGATTGACANALLEAGASEVCVWTVARGNWK